MVNGKLRYADVDDMGLDGGLVVFLCDEVYGCYALFFSALWSGFVFY